MRNVRIFIAYCNKIKMMTLEYGGSESFHNEKHPELNRHRSSSFAVLSVFALFSLISVSHIQQAKDPVPNTVLRRPLSVNGDLYIYTLLYKGEMGKGIAWLTELHFHLLIECAKGEARGKSC